MSYVAYESRTGECLDRVQALCRNLTTSGKFTDTSAVPLTDVEQFLSDAYYRLAGDLLHNGFGTAATDAVALSVLAQIQSLAAARKVQLAGRSGITEPDEKLSELRREYEDLIRSYVMGGKLEDLGMDRTSATRVQPELTGRSQSRKTTVYNDSDVPPSRFRRGFGQRPGSRTAAATTRIDE